MTDLAPISSENSPKEQTPAPTTGDAPEWAGLLDDVESAADQLSSMVDDLTSTLGAFEWNDDVPDEVREAADDASTDVYSAAADIDDRLRALRAAVARAENTDDNSAD